jgi:hypothetical protein
MTLLKPHNIGTHLKGIETSFQVVALFFKSFHTWASYITFWNFLKYLPSLKGQHSMNWRLYDQNKSLMKHITMWEK